MYFSVTRNASSLPSLASFDAVLFHMRDAGRHRLTGIPRSPGQRFVMFLMESPAHDPFPYGEIEGGRLRLQILKLKLSTIFLLLERTRVA